MLRTVVCIIILVFQLSNVLGGDVVNPGLLEQTRSGDLRNKYSEQDVRLLRDLHTNSKGVVTCTICREMVDAAFGWYESGDTRDEIVDKLTTMCVDLEIQTERVCRGMIDFNADIVLWMVDTKNLTSQPMTPGQMCGFALYGDCPLDNDLYDWTLDLNFLGSKPTPEIPQLPIEGSPTLKVLQFTDIHVDPNYIPGGNAECGEPLCCRSDQGPAVNETAEAGYWGEYRSCDFPVHAFQSMLQHAASTHQDLAYVIFTGDIIDGGVWQTSETYNSDLITFIRDEFARNFPSVPIIPILGNHEAHPVNVMSDPLKTEIPSNLQSSWLYELWADIWSPWLPPSTTADILSGGMFSLEVRPGLVVIGINTMFCYSYNWWLMYDNIDPAGELMWLAEKLLEAEQLGQKVHILAHHPSGSGDCMHFWSYQYRKIIDRFQNTVVAQFHGHTHYDHFNLYYDLDEPSRATVAAFTPGAGTPSGNRNANYRSYTVDGDYTGSSFRILDHETWYYNLTEANLAGSTVTPNWQKLYSFNEAYGLSAPFPIELDTLVHRMINDTELQQLYYRYYVRAGDPSLAAGCDESCVQSLICYIVTTVTKDTSKCNELYPSYN